MTEQLVFNHYVIVVGDPHDPFNRIIVNYHIREDKQLDSIDLIDAMVTPINNPERN